MKNKIMLSMLVAVLVIGSIAAVSATHPIELVKENNGNSGSIWTTTNLCGTEQQDVNKYNIGETVYINGAGFDAGDYEWTITGQPGQASCDPKIVVASDAQTVDSSGAFCFAAYTVQSDDCGEYSVDFGKKNDNYNVIPEFGTMVGVLTALSAVGVFFLVRRK